MKNKVNKTKFAIYLIWIIAALFTSTQLYLKTLDANGSDSWGKIFFIQFLVWNIWAGLSPLIFWLGKRFRIDRQTYYRGIYVHILLAFCIVLFYLAVYSIIWNFLGIGSFHWNTFFQYFKVFYLNLFHWHFFIYMAIIGVAHAIQYYKELQKSQLDSMELEKQLVISELNTLKAQLSPHFLFNTINNVVSTIEQGKNNVASGMLIRLGEFLRISLEESKHKLIALDKELEHIKKYLEIESFRNKELQVKFNIKKEHKNLKIPSFILQPLVENALKHGVSKSENAKQIEIGSSMEVGQLKLFIYNEGPRLVSASRRKDGIGLKNTLARLQKLYGKKCSLELFSVNDGVMVEMIIPTEVTYEI